MIGRTISHYRIVAKLGEGGMGVVYRAEDLSLGRHVALKFLPPQLSADPEAKRRFLHEARAAASLDHPGIGTVYEVGEAEGQPFIAMALLAGRTLKERIAEGPLPVTEALEVAAQVAAALQAAHAKGVVHRDVKPANIMLAPAGRAHVMDFGLAQVAAGSRLTRDGSTLGTAAYMSPEQARGEPVDRRTDVWSLGVVLFEMVSGRRPFSAEHDAALLYAILNESPPPLSSLRTGVPLEVERIVGKCLERDRELRYQHADEVIADLRRALAGVASGAERTATTVVAEAGRPPGGGRKLLRWAVPAAVVLLAAAFLLLRPVLFDEVLASSPRPIAVITFENRTGDAGLEHLREAIPSLLITSLEQSKYLRVVTWERLRDLLRQVGRPDTVAIDQETGFAMCRAGGVGTIVVGSFTRAGELFATDVKVLDVETKQLVASASARGRGVDSILESQIDDLSRRISRAVGLSERRIQTAMRPVVEVTTSSFEAYNWFLQGRVEAERMYFGEAVSSLERAVAIDSTFAMANLLLGLAYGRLGQEVQSRHAYLQASRFAGTATERERLYIEALSRQMLEKDYAGADPVWRDLIARYPNEKRARLWLSECCRARGRHREAIAILQGAVALDPTYGLALNLIAYNHMAVGDFAEALRWFERYAAVAPGDANPHDSMGELYLTMGRLDEAAAKYREVVRIKPDFGAQRSLSLVYALQEDWASARSWIASYIESDSSANSRIEGQMIMAWYLALCGNTRAAMDRLDAAAEIREPEVGRAAEAEIANLRAIVHQCRGEIALARRELARVLAVSRQRSADPVSPAILACHGLALCLCELAEGRHEAARSALDGVRALAPDQDERATDRVLGYLPNLCALLEAELLLAEDSPAEAVRAAGSAPPLGALTVGFASVAMYNFPVGRDVAARAHLRLGETAAAVAEYERLVTVDPRRRDRLLVAPVFHCRLARLYAAQGRAQEAAAQYRQFLAATEGADIWQEEIGEARRAVAAGVPSASNAWPRALSSRRCRAKSPFCA